MPTSCLHSLFKQSSNLIDIDKIKEEEVIVKSVGVSGTLKKAEKKYLKIAS